MLKFGKIKVVKEEVSGSKKSLKAWSVNVDNIKSQN